MATLIHDCPHCRASSMSFVIFGINPWPITTTGNLQMPQANVAAECQRCRAPIAAILKWRTAIDPNHWSSNLAKLAKDNFSIPSGLWTILSTYPEPRQSAAPDLLPAAVEKAFLQGETNLALPGHEEPAATMYRRALDLALQTQFPEMKGSIDAKLKKLAADHIIPKSLSEWAHEVRGIGNEGAHDLDGCTQEDAQAARDFVDAVLTYLITLPEMIRLRRPAPGHTEEASAG